MTRVIERHPAACQNELGVATLQDDAPESARAWLEEQAKVYGQHGLRWLLAHADDGVIWGRLDGDALATSYEAAADHCTAEKVCPPLRVKTLQQARLFGAGGELLLWRDGARRFHARLIHDTDDLNAAMWKEAFDEPQLLWGTHGTPLPKGFTLLRHGAEGLRHAFPISLVENSDEKVAPPRLCVRHYLNKKGFARVVASRLVRLASQHSS